MESRGLTIALKFPRENSGVVFVVAERFAVWRLMFLAEMRPGRFVALQCIDAHQFGEFEKIGDTTGAFQRLVVIFFVSRNADVVPEFFAQFGNFSEGFAQSSFASQHSAVVPEKKAEFAMEGIERARAVDLQ